jgi:RNA polymerase sigma-70 factor (ECF subfamily)
MKPITYPTTHWTAVLTAKGDDTQARAALGELCETYREPILRYIEREIRTDDPHRYGGRNAEDLTHDFLARLLERKMFAHLVRREGRFRAYLLGAVRHFIANVRQRESAAKRLGRSGDIVPGSLAYNDDNNALFDHDWAQATVNNAIALLGDASETQTLLPYLTQELTAEDRERLANELGKTEIAVKVALHRLRKKFRQLVREQIARTVESESEIDDELDYLIRSLFPDKRQQFS